MSGGCPSVSCGILLCPVVVLRYPVVSGGCPAVSCGILLCPVVVLQCPVVFRLTAVSSVDTVSKFIAQIGQLHMTNGPELSLVLQLILVLVFISFFNVLIFYFYITVV